MTVMHMNDISTNFTIYFFKIKPTYDTPGSIITYASISRLSVSLTPVVVPPVTLSCADWPFPAVALVTVPAVRLNVPVSPAGSTVLVSVTVQVLAPPELSVDGVHDTELTVTPVAR